MKKYLLAVLLFASLSLPAQDKLEEVHYNHRAFLELGGNGGTYLAGIENLWRLVHVKNLYWQGAFSVTPLQQLFVDVQAGLNYRIGTEVHMAEIGLGQLLVVDARGGKGGTVRFTTRFGYCWEPLGKRITFKIAYTPFISYVYNFQWEHWVGITVGWRMIRVFKKHHNE